MSETPHTHDGGSASDGDYSLVEYDHPQIDHPEWFTATVSKTVEKFMEDALNISVSYMSHRLTVEFTDDANPTVQTFYAYPEGKTGGRVSIELNKFLMGSNKACFNLKPKGIDRSEETIKPE